MTRVLAVFDSPHAVRRAVDDTTQSGWRIVSLRLPAFDESLLDLVGATQSPVGWLAFAGGVCGVLAGLALTIGTVRQWPGLIVGGKPLIAWPAFLIIVFELAILFASIGAVALFVVGAWRSRETFDGLRERYATDAGFVLIIEHPAAPGHAPPFHGAVEWRTL